MHNKETNQILTLKYLLIRRVQNVKILDSELALWFFPLHYMSEDTKKNFSSLAHLGCPPLETPICL